MGFYCCRNTSDEVFINDSKTFSEHFRKLHFGKKRSHFGFNCPLCSASLTNVDSIKRHFSRIHSDSVKFFNNEEDLTLQDQRQPSVPQNQLVSSQFSAIHQQAPAFPSQSSEICSQPFAVRTERTFQQQPPDSDAPDLNDDIDFDWPAFRDEQSDENSMIIDPSASSSNIDAAIGALCEQSSGQSGYYSVRTEVLNVLKSSKSQFNASEKAITGISHKWIDFFEEASKRGTEFTPEFFNQTRKYSNFYHLNAEQFGKVNESSILMQRTATKGDLTAPYYYTSFRHLIGRIVRNPKFLKLILEESKTQPNPDFYETYKDGLQYEKPSDPNLIVLNFQFYTDDVTIKEKLMMAYFTILNLPVYMQTSRSDIYLLAIVRRALISNLNKSTDIETFFDFMREFEEIQNNPIELGSNLKLTVNLVNCAGDILGLNELMKITRCMRLDGCGFCQLFYNEYCHSIDWLFGDKVKTLRPLPADHVFHPIVKPTTQHLYVIDLFHLFVEKGCFSKVLCPILREYYKTAADLKQLLDKLSALSLKNGCLEIRTQTCDLVGKGVQIIDFFNYFALIDDRVLRSSEHFKLYKLLRIIYNFYMSPKQAKVNVEKSAELISNFLQLYFKVFVESQVETFTPKMHILCHLPELTKLFSNLSLANTMKYERFHQTHKSKNRSSTSNINVEFNIFKTYLQTFDLQIPEDVFQFPKKQMNITQINHHLRKYSAFLNRDQPFNLVDSAAVNKIEFELGDVFVYEEFGFNRLPVFVQIEKMLYQNRLIIVGQKFVTNSYDSNRFLYSVTKLDELVELDYQHLVCFKKLEFREEISAINKTFHLPNESLPVNC